MPPYALLGGFFAPSPSHVPWGERVAQVMQDVWSLFVDSLTGQDGMKQPCLKPGTSCRVLYGLSSSFPPLGPFFYLSREGKKK